MEFYSHSMEQEKTLSIPFLPPFSFKPLKQITTDKVASLAAVSPDGKSVLLGLYNGKISLWDIEKETELLKFKGHKGYICSVAFSPDSKTILTGSTDNTIRLWDLKTGKELQKYMPTSKIFAGAFTPDESIILTALSNGTIISWDRYTGKPLQEFISQGSPLDQRALSSDGILALGFYNGKTSLVKSSTKEVLQEFLTPYYIAQPLTFSPDGTAILKGPINKTARLVDAKTGKLLQKFRSSDSENIYAATFSSNGKFVLTGGANGAIVLWETATGKKIREFIKHDNPVIRIALSPDEKTMFSVSVDGTIVLWGISSGVFSLSKDVTETVIKSAKELLSSKLYNLLAAIDNPITSLEEQ